MTIKVKHVFFVRRKRLKGGKTIARCIKKVKGAELTVEVINGVKMSVCTLDHPKVEGKLITDFLQLCNGTANFEPKDITYKSYFKGKKFELTGYNLEAKLVNKNRR